MVLCVKENQDKSSITAATESYGMFSTEHLIDYVSKKFDKNIVSKDTTTSVITLPTTMFKISNFDQFNELLYNNGVYLTNSNDSIIVYEINYKQ